MLDLGYDADGLYVGLGIGEYSDESGQYARAYAKRRGTRLVEVDLPDDYGFDVPTEFLPHRREHLFSKGMVLA